MSKSETFKTNAKVSQLLREARIKAGMTQAGLATKLKKPQSFVSKVETGQRQLTVADFAVICRITGLKPNDFFRRLNRE